MLVIYTWLLTLTECLQVTDACAKAVYTLVLTILPKDSNAASWAHSKSMLKNIFEQRVKKIETCPNDHIAFIDCVQPELAHYQHDHRKCCPVCGADRVLTLENGKKRAAKTVYHLPIGPWLHDLFRDVEIAPSLASDSTTMPPGHVTKSRGWYDKVNAYCRHKFTFHINVQHLCTKNQHILTNTQHKFTFHINVKHLYNKKTSIYLTTLESIH